MIRYCTDCGSRTTPQAVGTQQLSACPQCERIFFRNPKVVVTGLIEQGGRVLLVLRDIEPGRGLWGLPGGYVDWDEHPEAAMVRECEEETGALVSPDGLMAVEHITMGDQGIVMLAYRARLLGGEIRAREEVQQVSWFPPGALPPLAFTSHRAVLNRWSSDVLARGAA
ncbi:MAG TPA: NUDIX domain-containing protein [Candidatus Dormibacteraeota bacterium]